MQILCVLCQLFWEKRLEGLFACDKNGDRMTTLQLPHNIQGRISAFEYSKTVVTSTSHTHTQINNHLNRCSSVVVCYDTVVDIITLVWQP